jgi:hypothetical protein
MNETLEHNTTEQRTPSQAACQQASVEEAMKEATMRVEKGFEAAKEAVSDTLAHGERLLRRGRNSAEGYLDDFTHQVKHNPLFSLALAFGAGAIAAGLFTLMAPRRKRA